MNTWFALLAASASAQQGVADDAIKFIASRLTTVTGQSPITIDGRQTKGTWGWEPSKLARDGTRLSWSVYYTPPGGQGIFSSTNYAVDARNIAIPVLVKDNKIRMECVETKCVSADAKTWLPLQADSAKASSTQLPAVELNFESNDVAVRVSRALNDALKSLGAQQRRY